MPEIERPSDDILIVRLSAYHSLDLVRIPSNQKYRIVLAERLGVQRRAFVEISYEAAREIAKFLDLDVAAIVDSVPREETVPTEAPPLPSIPSRTSDP